MVIREFEAKILMIGLHLLCYHLIMMMLIAPRGDWGGIRRFLHSCSHLGELKIDLGRSVQNKVE